ncbi:hypothetical protein Y032_0126g1338 [Ancylostoma ceylanicum]|uniref:Uncharacterized protein n=1 Tax=Ancylostoma ceylanicum TaxID=53326 RepID=A0A016T8N6_9BILA|nr:hypothetical protein Y032_0126g1338 [Ancylostoma ceylanicum]
MLFSDGVIDQDNSFCRLRLVFFLALVLRKSESINRNAPMRHMEDVDVMVGDILHIECPPNHTTARTGYIEALLDNGRFTSGLWKDKLATSNDTGLYDCVIRTDEKGNRVREQVAAYRVHVFTPEDLREVSLITDFIETRPRHLHIQWDVKWARKSKQLLNRIYVNRADEKRQNRTLLLNTTKQSGSIKYNVSSDEATYDVDLSVYFGDYLTASRRKRGIKVKAAPELKVKIIRAEAVGDAAAVTWILEGSTSSDVATFVVE